MSYELLDHTADVKFRAVGSSREEAFSEAVKAFAEIVGSDPEAGEVRHTIEVESESFDALLFDFLDELIFLQDTEDVAVCHAEDLELEEGDTHRLKTVVWTQTIVSGMDLLDIKAPTYNEMKTDYKKGEGWILEAVLDI